MTKAVPAEVLEKIILNAADSVFAENFMKKEPVTYGHSGSHSANVKLRGTALPFAQVCSAWKAIITSSSKFKVAIVNIAEFHSRYYYSSEAEKKKSEEENQSLVNQITDLLSNSQYGVMDISVSGSPGKDNDLRDRLLKAITPPTVKWRSLDFRVKSGWKEFFLPSEDGRPSDSMDIDDGDVPIPTRIRRAMASLDYAYLGAGNERGDSSFLSPKEQVSVMKGSPTLKGLLLGEGKVATDQDISQMASDRPILTSVDHFRASGTANYCLFPLVLMTGEVTKSIELKISAESLEFPSWFKKVETRPSPTVLQLDLNSSLVIQLMEALNCTTTRSLTINVLYAKGTDGKTPKSAGKTINLPSLKLLSLTNITAGSCYGIFVKVNLPNLEALVVKQFPTNNPPKPSTKNPAGIEFPNLKVLILPIQHPYQLGLLQYMEMPSLKSVDLRHQRGYIRYDISPKEWEEGLIGVTGNNLSPIEHLTLQDVESRDSFTPLFKLTTNLKVLRIHDCRPQSSALSLMMRGKIGAKSAGQDSSVFLPKLERLEVETGRGNISGFVNCLVALAQARQNISFPLAQLHYSSRVSDGDVDRLAKAGTTHVEGALPNLTAKYF